MNTANCKWVHLRVLKGAVQSRDHAAQRNCAETVNCGLRTKG